MSEQTIKELSANVAQLKSKKSGLAAELKEITSQLEQAEYKLYEMMEEQDLSSIKTPEGTFSLSHRMFASVANEDDAFKFLKETKNDGLIKQTVNARSLTSVVKQMMDDGQVEFHEFEKHGINVYAKNIISLRKS